MMATILDKITRLEKSRYENQLNRNNMLLFYFFHFQGIPDLSVVVEDELYLFLAIGEVHVGYIFSGMHLLFLYTEQEEEEAAANLAQKGGRH